MRLFQNYLILVVASLIMIGCDKDDPGIEDCLMISETPTRGTIYDFNFKDGALRRVMLTSFSGVSNQFFEYDGKGHITKLVADGDLTINFFHEGENIIKLERYSGNTLTDMTEYEYSGTQLVKIQQYKRNGSAFQKSTNQIFEYHEGTDNISRMMQFDAGATVPTLSAEYTYGDNYAPLAAVPYQALKYFKLGGRAIGNNLVKIVFNSGVTTDYTYEFNDRGLPTKLVETTSKGSVVEVVYAYDCK